MYFSIWSVFLFLSLASLVLVGGRDAEALCYESIHSSLAFPQDYQQTKETVSSSTIIHQKTLKVSFHRMNNFH